MYINHNGMASNVANTLTSHYSNLATSTQRLSSGLRVNSAADDAAGLAIRELMRADISALNQGVRNANDAISMIQTADGALGIIDEKLIRMKELAEQAATGTYDSTQRLMIESEYQQMASEITRIANSTDFNNMKLLDGSLEGTHDGSKMESSGAMKIHFGTGNDSAEDYYYVEIGEVTAAALGVGNQSTWEDVQRRASKTFEKELRDQIKNSDLNDTQKGELYDQIDTAVREFNTAINGATNPNNAYKYWGADDKKGANGDLGFLEEGKIWESNSPVINNYLAAAGMDAEAAINTAISNALDSVEVDVAKLKKDYFTATGNTLAVNGGAAIDAKVTNNIKPAFKQALEEEFKALGLEDDTFVTALTDKITEPKLADGDPAANYDTWWSGVKTAIQGETIPDADQTTVKNAAIDIFMSGLRTSEKEKLNYAFGQAALANLANPDGIGEGGTDVTLEKGQYGIGFAGFSFGQNDAAITDDAEKMMAAALSAAQDKVKDMDVAGMTIETQEDAQHALVALDNAIGEKDKVRAHLGALQNRLENTVSNLTIQAENLQASESRISDVDVATEMTNFVRNQILTQSAVAMLSQANSMPQMAMQLIG